MTEQQQDPKPQAPEIPEAGGVAYTTLYGWNKLGEIMEISLTCRADSPKNALEGLWEAIGFSKTLVDANNGNPVLPHSLRPYDPRKGKLIMKQDGQPEPAQPPAQAPATTPAPAQTAPAPQGHSAPVAPAPTLARPPAMAPGMATTQAPAEEGIFICNRLSLSPQQGKESIKVDFYTTTQPNKYPAITWYAKPDQIFAAMSTAHLGKLEGTGWTPDHFGYAMANYEALPDFKIHWKRGKPTGKQDKNGQPTYYKDVIAITA